MKHIGQKESLVETLKRASLPILSSASLICTPVFADETEVTPETTPTELVDVVGAIQDTDTNDVPETSVEGDVAVVSEELSEDVAAAVEEVVADVVEDDVAPVVEEVVADVVEDDIAPVVEEVVADVIEEVAEEVADVVEDDVAPVVEEVTEDVAAVAEEVAEEVADVVEDDVALVAEEAAEDVAAVVEEVAEEVVDDVVESDVAVVSEEPSEDVEPVAEEALPSYVSIEKIIACGEQIIDTLDDGFGWADIPVIIKEATKILASVAALDQASMKAAVIQVVDFVIDHTDTPWLPDGVTDPLFKAMVPAFADIFFDDILQKVEVDLSSDSIENQDFLYVADLITAQFDDGFQWKDLAYVIGVAVKFGVEIDDSCWEAKGNAMKMVVAAVLEKTDTPYLPDQFSDPIFRVFANAIIDEMVASFSKAEAE